MSSNCLGTDFVGLKLKPDVVRRYGLPAIEYPIPADQLTLMLDGGELPFALMLYWLQLHSEGAGQSWQSLEAAMARLSELVAPQDQHAYGTVRGDDWFLELRELDLAAPLVAVQRRDHLIAALQARSDGRLVCAAYRPLDAKSIRYLIGLARQPGPDGSVCLRKNNWEYALDQASQSTSAFYANERGESYLSLWTRGLGVVEDGSIDDRFIGQRALSPLPPRTVATQLGVFYELSPGDEV